MIEDLNKLRNQKIDYGIWVSYYDLCTENNIFSGLTTIRMVNSRIVQIQILDYHNFSDIIGQILVVSKKSDYMILNFIILSSKLYRTLVIDNINQESLKKEILNLFKDIYVPKILQ